MGAMRRKTGVPGSDCRRLEPTLDGGYGLGIGIAQDQLAGLARLLCFRAQQDNVQPVVGDAQDAGAIAAVVEIEAGRLGAAEGRDIEQAQQGAVAGIEGALLIEAGEDR